MSRPDNLTKDEAIEAIIRFVQSLEPAPIWSEWYAGTTDQPQRELYEEHRASYTKSMYISVNYPATAKAVEEYLIRRCGMDGKPRGKAYPLFVYAFKKLRDTEPPLK